MERLRQGRRLRPIKRAFLPLRSDYRCTSALNTISTPIRLPNSLPTFLCIFDRTILSPHHPQGDPSLSNMRYTLTSFIAATCLSGIALADFKIVQVDSYPAFGGSCRSLAMLKTLIIVANATIKQTEAPQQHRALLQQTAVIHRLVVNPLAAGLDVTAADVSTCPRPRDIHA